MKNTNKPTPDVEALYHELNNRFFDSLLPTDYQIKFVPVEELNPDYGDEGGEHDGVSRTIKLTEPLRNRTQPLRRMLIHEMVHAATGGEHDEAFFNRLVEIAYQGEDWAWEEAREYHPCCVRNLIHPWREYHPKLKRELDPRRLCKCEACRGWRERGFPLDEPLEKWRPWEPEGAPVHPHAEWIEKRAYELFKENKCEDISSGRDKARQEAESLY